MPVDAKIRKLSAYDKLFCGLVIALLLSYLFPAFFLLSAIIFPAIFIFKLTKNNFLLLLPLLLLVNGSVLVVTAAIFSLAGIPINILSVSLAIIGLSLWLLQYVRKDKFLIKVELDHKERKTIYALYGVFFLAIISRVFSVIGTEAPITHDPITHAFWANQISTTQAIEHFYPSGLHTLIAFVAESLHINHALSTLYTTNFLNAFSVLSWSTIAFTITRNRIFSLLVAFLMLLVPYPAILYFTAGKNAYVAGAAFAPLIFWSLYRFLKNINKVNAAVLTLCIQAIFFIYYPVFGYMAVFTGLMLIATLIYKLVKEQNTVKLIGFTAVAAFIVLVISGSWFLSTYDSYVDRSTGRVSRAEVDDQFTAKTLRTDPMEFKYISELRTTANQLKAHSDRYSTFIFPLAILSLAAIPFIYRKPEYLAIPGFATAVLAVIYVFNLINMPGVAIIKTAGIYLYYQIFALSLAAFGAFVLSKANLDKKRVILISATLLALSLYVTHLYYSEFTARSDYQALVNEGDTEALKWIDNNIEDEDALFLNDARKHDRRINLIFSVGASSWLPVYTGNEIIMPFYGEQFNAIETHKNYSQYLRLEDQPMAALCELNQEGAMYYYRDLNSVSQPEVNVIESVPKDAMKEIYANEGAEIYRINIDTKDCS